MTELKELKIEKKKFSFGRFESPWRDPFFDPLRPMFGSQPILWEPLPQANPLVRPPLPLLRGKKWKALINLRKSEYYGLKVRSLKNSKSLLKSPRSLCWLLPSTQKCWISPNCWNPTGLAGTGLLTATGKPTEIATIEIFDKTHRLRFYENHICFFLSVFKKKQQENTLHLHSMCGGIKTLKHNVRTTVQLAYHGCKNLSHTSKTRHVKCTQVVVTVRFTIRVTLLHRWNKQGIKICNWFLAYFTCGVKLLEYTYAQVWIIAKRKKQSPIGWFL